MSSDTGPQPTEIQLHSKSRLLEVAFDSGERFHLPCEYLRVFSRAAEVRALDRPETGKEGVNITAIEPVGGYAVRLRFDDGHDTGIYSWDTLHELGVHQERNWAEYLRRLQDLGYTRRAADGAGPVTVRLLLFATLPAALGRTQEELSLPDDARSVDGLLALLRTRGGPWATLLAPERITATVNRQFAEGFTRLAAGDEVALVPKPT